MPGVKDLVMRKDVKLGLVLSLVVVVVAGLYYVRRDKAETPLTLGDSNANPLSDKAAAKKAGTPADPREVKPGAAANRATTPRRTTTEQPPRTSVPPAPRGTAANPTPAPGSTDTRKPAAAPLPTDAKPQSGAEVKPGSADKSTPAAHEPPARVDAATPAPTGEGLNELFRFDQTPPVATGTTPKPPAGSALPEPKSGTATLDSRGAPPLSDPNKAVGPAPLDGGKAAPPLKNPSPDALSGSAKSAERTHTVQRGDSYAILAEQYYGSQRHAKFLMDANPQYADARKLRAGVVLRIPPLSGAEPKAPGIVDVAPVGTKPAVPAGAKPAAPAASAAGQTAYQVKEGDTFYRIAQHELGSGDRWNELFELNKDVVKGKPERLRPGQTIQLPSKKVATSQPR